MINKAWLLPGIMAVSLAGAGVLNAFISHQAADVVIGHRYFSQTGSNGNDAEPNTLNYPGNVFSDGTRLYIADSINNRVLIFNTFPDHFNSNADIVVGQPDRVSNQYNQGGMPGPNTLHRPTWVHVFSNHLFIADTHNNRVLIYNSIPTSNNASADIVIGQANMTSTAANQETAGAAANTLYWPTCVSVGGSQLFVTDSNNNRVLIYNNPIPNFNNSSANVVVGQLNMNSNNPEVAANRLFGPWSAELFSGQLLIADRWNNRVLVYNYIPGSDNASASYVIGQPDMTSYGANQGGAPGTNTLYGPSHAFYNGSKLFVADTLNNRALVFNAIPAANNSSAAQVIGQFFMNENSRNQGQDKPNGSTLYEPISLYASAKTLFISDSQNNRVLSYQPIPDSGFHANMVIGQNDLIGNRGNRASTSEKTLSTPSGVLRHAGKLYVSDSGNNRILIYPAVPAQNWAQAGLVLGQTAMTDNGSNRGGGAPSSDTLSNPFAIYAYGQKFIVADIFNHRVLIYNTLPAANGGQADVVIGQPDFAENGANQNLTNPTEKTLMYPRDAYTDGQRFYIADMLNHRVLIFNSIPAANHPSADVVIGQANMTSGLSNQGNAKPGANTLDWPCCVRRAGNKLIIADDDNSRILIYNSVPTSNNSAADVVIGQANMTSDSNNQGGSVAANTLFWPNGLAVWQDALYISDTQNHRILIYHNIPTSNNASADIVLGQKDMTSAAINQKKNPNNQTLYSPIGLCCDDTGLYVADRDNNRLLIFQIPPHTPTITPTSTQTPWIDYKNEIKAYNSRFNPEKGQKTYIRWHQAETARTTIKLYNLRGELVRILLDGVMCNAGQPYEAVWNGLNVSGSTVASGIYIVHIEAGLYRGIVKIAVIK